MQLKEFFFRISIFYKILPISFLMKLAKKKSVSPFYHFVDDGENNLVNNLYQSKTKDQFIRDIQYFKKHFSSLSIFDITQGKLNKNQLGFFLSFDDGLSNFYSTVAPILLKEKVYAINFLNSNFIDNKALFYRYKVNIIILQLLKNKNNKSTIERISNLLGLDSCNLKKIIKHLKTITILENKLLDDLSDVLVFSFDNYLKNEKPYLNENQILELMKQGFYFGAHSKSHTRYSQISLKDQLIETIESVTEINSQFNLNNNYFAFPFSDDGVTKDFFNIINLSPLRKDIFQTSPTPTSFLYYFLKMQFQIKINY